MSRDGAGREDRYDGVVLLLGTLGVCTGEWTGLLWLPRHSTACSSNSLTVLLIASLLIVYVQVSTIAS